MIPSSNTVGNTVYPINSWMCTQRLSCRLTMCPNENQPKCPLLGALLRDAHKYNRIPRAAEKLAAEKYLMAKSDDKRYGCPIVQAALYCNPLRIPNSEELSRSTCLRRASHLWPRLAGMKSAWGYFTQDSLCSWWFISRAWGFLWSAS